MGCQPPGGAWGSPRNHLYMTVPPEKIDILEGGFYGIRVQVEICSSLMYCVKLLPLAFPLAQCLKQPVSRHYNKYIGKKVARVAQILAQGELH